MDSGSGEAGERIVYVVDDDASVCRALERLLRSYGVCSTTFSSASELLEGDGWRRAGCFLLDVRMPGMSGTELARRLRESGSTAPIIFMSAHADASEGAGEAAQFFRKPLDDRRLVAALREALDLG